MSGRQGTAVVLEAGTGKLVACHDPRRAALRQARPGSAVKPFTLAALLETGSGKAAPRIPCRREVRLAGRRLDCTHLENLPPFDAVAALAWSCNWYFTQAARRLSPDGLVAAFERAGLVARTGLIEREATGNLRRTESQEQLALQAVGESAIEVTPLALASAYRRLAAAVTRRPELSYVLEGMVGCVRYGTGQAAARVPIPVAGKTGTASGPGGAYTHAWFAGFAPATAPDIVLVVFLEQGQGAFDAAPVAASILEGLVRVGRLR